MALPRVLLTGFGPFPGAAENSSAWLVEELAGNRQASGLGCDLHAEILPTEWAEVAKRGPGLVQHHRPRLTLHLGLHKRARGFRIERSAHNLIDLREDARGAVLNRRTILDRSDRRLDTEVSATQLARHLLAHDLPAVASRSAGTYLCNYLYYLSLHWARGQNGACDVCFVHLPPGPRQGGPLSEAELLRGTELIMRYLLAFALHRDQAKNFAGEMAAGFPVAAGSS
ncbi:MAG TPA: pyroglutamyl-peptidase I [Methyloceanibacter sp.]|nr:pyroglutamyl-peptidase I [Methyloceanibacter sp.]